MDIQRYWQDCINQRAAALKEYFHPEAKIFWHNTNEHFTLEEFIVANCEYPGDWIGNLERVIQLDGQIITAVHICSADGKVSVHATSFFKIQEDKITRNLQTL